jgi:phosphomannomutase
VTLIKSISGIRGTIGGKPGEGLSPLDVVKFTASYATWAKEKSGKNKIKIVVGRDARISGAMVSSIVISTLSGMGCDVVNIGLATTPTTELAVTAEKADGGIILTASHNPKQWNALKLLDSKGEFLNGAEGEKILQIAETEDFNFAEVDNLGTVTEKDYIGYHIQQVLNLDLVDKDAIEKAGFSVAVDAVNSVGGIAMPALFKALGIKNIVEINCEPTGHFAHTPEPLPENLVETSEIVKNSKVDVCFVVDPDVDRLVIINEDGSMFNEEYTLVAVSDYILISNSRKHGFKSFIEQGFARCYRKTWLHLQFGSSWRGKCGGQNEGNRCCNWRRRKRRHYLSCKSLWPRFAGWGSSVFNTPGKKRVKCSELRKTYPDYFMSKNKIELTPDIDVDAILVKMKEKYSSEQVTDIDGVKIDLPNRGFTFENRILNQ